VAGAFSVTPPEAVRGRRVLLVDDLYDSGATLTECAHALTRAGAREVYVVTAVKTIHH
jgi:predicted amidophosphoribosyltransferase